jgi:hypothetical protein
MKEMQTYVFVIRAEKPLDAKAWSVKSATLELKQSSIFNTDFEVVRAGHIKPGQAFYLEVDNKGRINKSLSGLKVIK